MNKKITVAYYLPALADGGAETLVKDYCLLIDKNVFKVMIIVNKPFFNNSNYKALIKSNIKIISIYNNYNFAYSIFDKLFGKLYIPFVLSRVIRKEKPNVIHIHLSLLNIMSKVKGLKKDVGLFYTCHSFPSKYIPEGSKENVAIKKLISKYNLIPIALHKNMAIEINTLLNTDKTVVIRNGIDFNRFKKTEYKSKDYRNVLGIPDNAFVIGNIARLVDFKNHDFLISLFNEVKKKKNNAFLLLIGNGKLKETIIEKLDSLGLSNDYQILEHRTDIPELLNIMDVFVFPSIYEGFGIALVEAQAVGLRCICSKECTDGIGNVLSSKTICLGLDEPIKNWVNAVLDDSITNDCYDDISKYDMNKEIKRLENLYLGTLNE